MSDIPPPSTSLTTLLPFLFAPEPTTLPVHLLSPTTHLSHTFLSTSPSSPSYLQLIPSGMLSALHARLVERGLADLELGPPLYTIEDGGIRARVEVAIPAPEQDPRETNALAVELVWEQGGRDSDEEDDAGPRWLFVTLALVARGGPCPRGWHQTIEFARVSATKAVPSEADFLPPSSIPITPRVPAKAVEDMASGEGTTPGAYGAAEDFWSGWSYDGDGDEGADERAEFVSEAAQERKLQDAQEGYWDSYGEVESSVGEVDLEEEERQSADDDAARSDGRPKSITRSRRSSTIRAPPLVTPPPPTTSTRAPASPFFQPLPPSLHPPSAPSTSAHAPSPVSSPALVPVLSSAPPKATNGFHPVTASGDGDGDEALQFALAGVWALYSKGATWDELEQRREKWDRMARMVSRA